MHLLVQEKWSAVLKEIEAMKGRIAELEAELKGHASSEQPAAVLAAAPATESSSIVASRIEGQAPAESSSAAPAAATIGAEKLSKSQPFAFADWTWLNGNPRTKDTPLATKYFTPEIRVDTNYTEDYN